MPARKFRIAMSERCFRFKPDALPSHAPHKPGVYEFVTFDEQKNPVVLFVGLALTGSVYEALAAHMDNKAAPTANELFAAAKDVYFDYVASADITDVDELKDIAGVFIARHKPRFNAGPAPASGRHESVEVEEVD
ncbi:MAG: hypothetical protein Q8T11_07415 [Elusimicrobiota bacterium]|nr:hypothetical protein [Elusimicrobiota bacterium]